MTTEIQNLKLNIRLADKLVSQLSLLDGRGYDLMGEFSQNFLMSLADKGAIGSAYVEGYFREFQNAFNTVTWIGFPIRDKSQTWLRLVDAYRLDPSEVNAQHLLDF